MKRKSSEGSRPLSRMDVSAARPPVKAAVAGAFLFGLAVSGVANAQVISIGEDGTATTLCTRAQNQRHQRVSDTAISRPAAKARPIPAAYRGAFEAAAARYELSPDLLQALAWQESRFQPNARSPKGAMGLMQLMPATARSLGVDPNDPAQNIMGGAAYLRYMLNAYDGRIDMALAAYNAGQGAVNRYGGIPPYKETRTYVSRNLDHLASLSEVADAALNAPPPDLGATPYIEPCR